MHRYYGYDFETYPNIITCSVTHIATGDKRTFEISDRKNEFEDFLRLCDVLIQSGAIMVGFNNVGFDYIILHDMIKKRYLNPTYFDIYTTAMKIINTPYTDRFKNIIWDNQRYIKQLDLYLLHHFDGVDADGNSKATSLKMIEFNSRSSNVGDLPFPVGTMLEDHEKDILIKYNDHDTAETIKFFHNSIEEIKLREVLSKQYGKDFTNYNDTKIGQEIFVMKLEQEQPGICYDYSTGRKQTRGTPRDSIHLGGVILPYIKFDRPEFQNIVNKLNATTITKTKGALKNVSAVVDGFSFDFGLGGIHASIDPCTIHSDDEFAILDIDVEAYYPSIGFANNVYPEHLGPMFCAIAKSIKEERARVGKKTPTGAALKLANNGAWGKSNSKYSPFYDPKYTMTITINGQLLLCMLAEKLMTIDRLTMVQCNTDGMTVRVPRKHVELLKSYVTTWEATTGLKMEYVNYKRMFIRDVNNYIGEFEDGSVKLKGAYAYDRAWDRNHGMLIVPKAAEAALIHGVNIRDFIYSSIDIYDFCKRAKADKGNILVMVDPVTQEERRCQKVTRYYVAKNAGGDLVKVLPAKGELGTYKRKNSITDAEYFAVMGQIPQGSHDERIHTKNKSKYDERRTMVEKGYTVVECDDISRATFDNLNYDYYINEVEKLVKPLLYGINKND